MHLDGLGGRLEDLQHLKPTPNKKEKKEKRVRLREEWEKNKPINKISAKGRDE